MKVERYEDTLRFKFLDIRLVDSMTNFTESQGFISYSINIHNDVLPEDIIYNKADIIFDQNEPIITNQTWNTVVDRLTCFNLSSDLIASSDTLFADAGAQYYTWVDCESNVLVQESDQNYFVAEYNGLYQVIMEGENCVLETICYPITISNTKDINNWEYKIMPNPSNEWINIQSSLRIDRVRIYNSFGEELGNYTESEINVGDFSAGIYWIELQIGSQKTKCKLVKY